MKWIEYFERVLNDFSAFGSVVFFLVFCGVMISFKEYSLFIKSISFLIMSTLLIAVVRLLVFRKRPNKKKFETIIEKVDAGSFPSAHSSRIFFLATILFGMEFAIGALGAVVALIVCYTRVRLAHHRTIDAIAGAGIGIILGLIM